MNITHQDTIAAIATPSGNGGVGIIRLSGTQAKAIAEQLTQKKLQVRYAHFAYFYEADNRIIDSGIALYFAAPASFTGEDTVEIQGHGGAVILDMLLRRLLSLGCRLANPGEFSERAYLNGKLDLAQAEAIADLITSSTEQSARSAQKSMQGVFSSKINELVEELIELRVYVEAAIDFVDEEIDFLTDGVVKSRVQRLLDSVETTRATAQQGQLLRDGMTVVLAGKPNAGKSSLLNELAGHDAAIVTEIAGTTRDVLKERIQIDGMPLHIIDTAGLRESENAVEQEGIRRAHAEIQKADKILLLIDVNDPDVDSIVRTLPKNISVTQVYNKIDLLNIPAEMIENEQGTKIYLSIKQGVGIDLLKQHLKKSVGFDSRADHVFIARRRHTEALEKASGAIQNALSQLQENQAGELVAEDLRQAQNYLSEITGEFTSDALLGKIFGSFCIGK